MNNCCLCREPLVWWMEEVPATMCSSAFSQSGNAFIFSFQRSQELFELYLWFCKTRSWWLTTGRAGLERLWSSPTQIKSRFRRCDGCTFLWASWGGVWRNVKIAVGVVVLEIQCCTFLASLEDLLRGRPGPTFNLTSAGLRCWPYGLGL